MKAHKLKIKNDYLHNILIGNKKSEVRINDRDFQVGDTVRLYDLDKLGLSQKIYENDFPQAIYIISHIHSGFGMADNYVILSFKKLI